MTAQDSLASSPEALGLNNDHTTPLERNELSTNEDSARRSILAAGYTPLDIVQYQGRKWHAAGGTAGNVAAILGFLGWDATLITDYGDDEAGRNACRDLQAANVSIAHIRLVSGYATPRLIHEIDGAGHRYLFRCPACGTAFPHSRPLRLDRATEITNLGLHPDVYFFDRVNAGTLHLAEHFARSGSLVVFEPSRPARSAWTQRALAAAHIIKYADDRKPGLGEARPRPGQLWVITGGVSGTRFRLGDGKWHDSPAFAYPVVDAGGAGDWTTAGMMHALPIRGRRTVAAVADALAWAQAVAAVSCGCPGARGLARGQSADAVLRAAQFVQRRDNGPYEPAPTIARSAAVPPHACRVCLQPIVSADIRSDASSGSE
jgi:fructokinase